MSERLCCGSLRVNPSFHPITVGTVDSAPLPGLQDKWWLKMDGKMNICSCIVVGLQLLSDNYVWLIQYINSEQRQFEYTNASYCVAHFWQRAISLYIIINSQRSNRRCLWMVRGLTPNAASCWVFLWMVQTCCISPGERQGAVRQLVIFKMLTKKNTHHQQQQTNLLRLCGSDSWVSEGDLIS